MYNVFCVNSISDLYYGFSLAVIVIKLLYQIVL